MRRIKQSTINNRHYASSLRRPWHLVAISCLALHHTPTSYASFLTSFRHMQRHRCTPPGSCDNHKRGRIATTPLHASSSGPSKSAGKNKTAEAFSEQENGVSGTAEAGQFMMNGFDDDDLAETVTMARIPAPMNVTPNDGNNVVASISAKQANKDKSLSSSNFFVGKRKVFVKNNKVSFADLDEDEIADLKAKASAAIAAAKEGLEAGGNITSNTSSEGKLPTTSNPVSGEKKDVVQDSPKAKANTAMISALKNVIEAKSSSSVEEPSNSITSEKKDDVEDKAEAGAATSDAKSEIEAVKTLQVKNNKVVRADLNENEVTDLTSAGKGETITTKDATDTQSSSGTEETSKFVTDKEKDDVDDKAGARIPITDAKDAVMVLKPLQVKNNKVVLVDSVQNKDLTSNANAEIIETKNALEAQSSNGVEEKPNSMSDETKDVVDDLKAKATAAIFEAKDAIEAVKTLQVKNNKVVRVDLNENEVANLSSKANAAIIAANNAIKAEESSRNSAEETPNSVSDEKEYGVKDLKTKANAAIAEAKNAIEAVKSLKKVSLSDLGDGEIAGLKAKTNAAIVAAKNAIEAEGTRLAKPNISSEIKKIDTAAGQSIESISGRQPHDIMETNDKARVSESFSTFSGLGEQNVLKKNEESPITSSNSSGFNSAGGFGSFGQDDSNTSMPVSQSDDSESDEFTAEEKGDGEISPDTAFSGVKGFDVNKSSREGKESESANEFSSYTGFSSQDIVEKEDSNAAVVTDSSNVSANSASDGGGFGSPNSNVDASTSSPFSAFTGFENQQPAARKDEADAKDTIASASSSGFAGFGNQETGTNETAGMESTIPMPGWTQFGATGSLNSGFSSFNSESSDQSDPVHANGDAIDADTKAEEGAEESSPFAAFTGSGNQQFAEKDETKDKAAASPFSGLTGFDNKQTVENGEGINDVVDSKSVDDTSSSNPFSEFSNNAATHDEADANSTLFFADIEERETSAGDSFSDFSSIGSTTGVEVKDAVNGFDTEDNADNVKPGGSFSGLSAFGATEGETVEKRDENNSTSLHGEDFATPVFSGFTDYGVTKDDAQVKVAGRGVCNEDDTKPDFSGLTDYGVTEDKDRTGDNVIDVDAQESKPAFSGITDYGDTKDEGSVNKFDSKKEDKKTKSSNNPFSIFASFGMPKDSTGEKKNSGGNAIVKEEEKEKSGGFFSGFMGFGKKKIAKEKKSEVVNKGDNLAADATKDVKESRPKKDPFPAVLDSGATRNKAESKSNASDIGTAGGEEKTKPKIDSFSAFEKFTSSTTKDLSSTKGAMNSTTSSSGFGSFASDIGSVGGEEKDESKDISSSPFEKFTGSSRNDVSSTEGALNSTTASWPGFGSSASDIGSVGGKEKDESKDISSSPFEKFAGSSTNDVSSTEGALNSATTSWPGFGSSASDTGTVGGKEKDESKDVPSSPFEKFTGSTAKDVSSIEVAINSTTIWSGFGSSASDTGTVGEEEKDKSKDVPSSPFEKFSFSSTKDASTSAEGASNPTTSWSGFERLASVDSSTNATIEMKVEENSDTPFSPFDGFGNQAALKKNDTGTEGSSSFSSGWSGFDSFGSISSESDVASVQTLTTSDASLSNFTDFSNATATNTSSFSPAWSGFDSVESTSTESTTSAVPATAEKFTTKPVPASFSDFIGLGIQNNSGTNATAAISMENETVAESSTFTAFAEFSDEGYTEENSTAIGQFVSAMNLNDQENAAEDFVETDLDEKPAVRIIDDYRNYDADTPESSPAVSIKNEIAMTKSEATPAPPLLDPRKAKELNKRAAELLSDDDVVVPTPVELNFANFASTMLSLNSADDAKNTLETMERIAKHARELNDDTNCTVVPPSKDMYNLVIKSYAKDSKRKRKAQTSGSNYHDDGNSALMAEALLYQMQMSEYDNVSPDVETYTSLLECWANSMNLGDYGVSRAEELLQILIKEDKATTQNYNSVILAHLRSNRPSSAEKANGLLSRMEELYNATGNKAIKPDALSYTATINCLAKSTSEVDLQHGLEWAHRMEATGVDPNIRTFAGIIECIAAYYQRLEVIHGGNDELNSELINRLKSILSSMKDFGITPNVYVYGLILDVLSKKSSPHQIVNVLNIMSRNGVEPNAFCYSAAINSYVYSDLPPDEIVGYSLSLLEQCPLETRNSVMYTGVINAFTRLAPYLEDAAMEATRLHNTMINSYKRTKLQEFKPTTLTYSALINCWAKSRARNRPEIAQTIYNELQQWYRNTGGDPDLEVTTVASNALLDAFARSATMKNSHAWECQVELQKIAEPDVRSYGAVILAYANTGTWDASLNATRLVDDMVRQGVEPNEYTYTSVFSALSNSFRPEVKDRTLDITLKLMNEMNGGNVNKNVQLCTAIFDVLGKCGDIGTIMKIYQHMVQDLGVLPTPATHQVLVSSFLNNNSSKYAEDYLKEHIETMSIRTLNLMLRHFSRTRQTGKLRDLFYSRMLPDRVNALSYTTFINALSKSASEKTAYEAEQLVQEMYSNGIVQPNLFTYNALLNTWLKSGSPQAPTKCVDILQVMESQGIEPDKISYTCYIGTWAKMKPEQGMRILEYVEDSNLAKLDRVPYFSLINAFAIRRNVEMVMLLVQRMKENGIYADKRLHDVILDSIDRSDLPRQRKQNMIDSIPYAIPQRKKKKFSFL